MRSLRRQLTISLLLSLALILGGGGAVVFLVVHDSLMDQFDAALRVKALIVIGETDQRNGDIDVEFSDRFLREFDDDVATDFFQVFHLDGRSEERSDSLYDHNLPIRHGTMEEPLYWNLSLPDGEPGRAIGIRFTPRTQGRQRDNQKRLEVIVVVAAKRTELDATLGELRTIVLAASAALLGLTTLAVALVLRRGLRPLALVGEQATQIDATSLQTRFQVDVMPAELRPICSRLNDLLSRLEESFDRERRFSSDLAHELRTPLAELRAQAEFALRWPDEGGGEIHEQTLEIAVQMEALVTRLLAMGRAEQGHMPLAIASIEIGPLIQDTLSRYATRIGDRQLAVEVHVSDDAVIDSDPLLLRTIVTNLVDNAVQYAPPGSPVALRFSGQGQSFSLQVENIADQLTADDLPRLFDRFWRKDAARTDAENSGLGLSLSRSFARVLGADLVAELADDHMLIMTLRRPA